MSTLRVDTLQKPDNSVTVNLEDIITEVNLGDTTSPLKELA